MYVCSSRYVNIGRFLKPAKTCKQSNRRTVIVVMSVGALPTAGTMTKEQEDKIIAQAQDILERRMAVEKDIKINLRSLVYYGAYYQGALDAVSKIFPTLFSSGRKPKGEDWIFLQAEWELITSSKRNMQLFLDGTRIAYRNHRRDKKGRIESCDAYFIETINVMREIK